MNEEQLECIICMMEDRTYTETSDVCLHWNRICRECKERLFSLEKNNCPYCSQCWLFLMNREFKESIAIRMFIQSLSDDYDVFTEEEANHHCKLVLLERLHEIEYDVISTHFKDGCFLPKEVFETFVSKLEDDSNPIVEQLIQMDNLCNHLIETRGRGYIIAVDEMEIPLKIFGRNLFAYAKDN